jgi:hypothetical protein
MMGLKSVLSKKDSRKCRVRDSADTIDAHLLLYYNNWESQGGKEK